MRHFLTTDDWTRDELQALLDTAKQMKIDRFQPRLKNKSIALVFFNPSLRTRTSFELGMTQLGGKAIVLEPGKSAWPIEFTDGSVMDGKPEEHIREAARVLGRYCDLIAVRCFPLFEDWQVDRQDTVIRQMAKHSPVPVINMETIVHPCQEMALMQAVQEQFEPKGEQTDGKKFVMTWVPHPRPLNTAVANSGVLISSKFGFDVTLLCPTPEYVLDERYISIAKRNCEQNGRSFTVSHDIESAYDGADVIYAKSWGALPYFGRWEAEKPIRDAHQHFIVDGEKMARTNNAVFSHCLPMRRNVKATDEVADADLSLIIEEAENRLHVQKALMDALINQYQ